MTDAEAAQVKIDCPRCGGSVPEPVHRGNLETVVHRRGKSHAPCRFIVSVDPTGEDHRFRVLSTTERFEEVQPEMWQPHSERVRRAALADLFTRRQGPIAWPETVEAG